MKSSLTNITHLSDDLLQQILIRMPSKYICRCKCVTKRWCDLISGSSFIYVLISYQHSLYNTFFMFFSSHEIMLTFLHHLQSLPTQNTPSSLIPRTNVQTQQNFNISSTMVILRGSVCGSSNGLILGCNNRYTCGYGYYVYNPFSKECIQIPPPSITFPECIYAVGFVCYKEKRRGNFIDNYSYRVVIIQSFIAKLSEFKVEVFSSETQQWEQHNVSLPNGFAFAPHWLLSFEYNGWLYFMGRKSIFVFDPYSNESYTLSYPDDADDMNIMSFGFLGSSCRSLRIGEIGHKYVMVWELQDDGNWHLIHRTDLSLYLSAKFCTDYHKRIGGFHPHDGDIVYLCSYIHGAFVANLRKNKFEPIDGYDKCNICPFQLELPLLMPSHASPK
ncbi:unnamed protein product [Lupinus luteus]|uniref:F-box domain-containing protein n=1 Tax=Lupinus luteus TaxID=3873 RepID=A0AAV1WH01_LUPLU